MFLEWGPLPPFVHAGDGYTSREKGRHCVYNDVQNDFCPFCRSAVTVLATRSRIVNNLRGLNLLRFHFTPMCSSLFFPYPNRPPIPFSVVSTEHVRRCSSATIACVITRLTVLVPSSASSFTQFPLSFSTGTFFFVARSFSCPTSPCHTIQFHV